MNPSDLLDQFIAEARECLEVIGQRLLDVEKAPDDKELLNDLFRQVHTLKGNCGLFEFKPLERVVHAGEDLLDRVRRGTLGYGESMADALLLAMDYTASLVDAIESQGQLPADAEARSQALATMLRAQLDGSAGAPPAPGSSAPAPKQPASAGSSPAAPASPASARAAGAAAAPPEWVQRLPASTSAGTASGPLVALRYTPEPECFFKGEDPWRLALASPGLLHLSVDPLAPWPPADALDCYRCNLELLALCDAPLAYLEEHFRYVPEQVELHVLEPSAAEPPAAPEPDATRGLIEHRARQLWQDQRAVLARPGLAAGTVAAVRQALQNLLPSVAAPDAAAAALASLQALPPGAAPLAQWAQAFTAGAAGAGGADADGGSAAAGADARQPLVATPEPRLGAAAAAPADAEGAADRGQRVLKVSQEKIDRLMDLIGEMVVAKNALPYLAERAEDVFGQRELSREIKAQYAVINRIAEDMQHAVLQVRMLPVGTIFQRFSRLVRDLSKKLGKDVELLVEGEDTEADKNVIEALADPLIHIVRNSLDHGLETPAVRRAAGKPAHGTLRISARQEGDRVVIEIADDGAGIDTARVRAKAVERGLIPADRAGLLSDADAVQLVFLPGFSTADAISDLSGRGVGMDVVRSAVDRVNGTVQLASQAGVGTTLTLSLPLSMAVTNVMMIETAGRRFGVPMDLIVETVRVHADDIHHFKQAQTTVLRGRIVPLRTLHGLLALDDRPRPNEDGELAVLVVRLGAENIGLLVDDFHGTSDIILKPLEGVLSGLTGFAGTALMGDGSVLMILNPKELL